MHDAAQNAAVAWEQAHGLFCSADRAQNARDALAYWERHEAETIVTNGAAYVVALDATPQARGWYQTSPEEIEGKFSG